MGEKDKRPWDEIDEEIKKALAQDSYVHFPLVITEYWGQLVNYAAKQVGIANAEDVVQTALMNACEGLRGFSQERIFNLKLRSWLYTIVSNECKHFLRRKTPLMATIDLDDDESFVKLVASVNEQPEAAFEFAEISDAILAAIDRLPPLYRNVIFLRYIKDMKGIDIAKELDRDLNAIKAQIKRGTALLQRHLLNELEARGENQISEKLKKRLSVDSERKQKEEKQ